MKIKKATPGIVFQVFTENVGLLIFGFTHKQAVNELRQYLKISEIELIESHYNIRKMRLTQFVRSKGKRAKRGGITWKKFLANRASAGLILSQKAP